MQVNIKRIDRELPLPHYATDGSCGFDMYSRVTVTIDPQQIVLLPSNLIIQTPSGYVLLLTPRSSLAKKKGLTMPHSIGVIDQDYSGREDEILIQVQNVTAKQVTVERGERLAQGIFVRTNQADWQEVESITSKNRGGIGSTGGYHDLS
jgi:dUTP pyrophosphatase